MKALWTRTDGGIDLKLRVAAGAGGGREGTKGPVLRVLFVKKKFAKFLRAIVSKVNDAEKIAGCQSALYRELHIEVLRKRIASDCRVGASLETTRS